MEWIHDYALFLFDFDGLLVDTEQVHYHAYRAMCRNRGFDLSWDFRRYLAAAHYSAVGLKEEMYREFPTLEEQEPRWELLYAEKRAALLDFYRKGEVALMPGVETLLAALETAAIPCCVVTHSDSEQVALIRQALPQLDTIPHWITRHDYSQPKPHPECYLAAIKRFAKPGAAVIGFEDSPRGLKALMQTPAQPLLITTIDYPEIPAFIRQGVLHYPSIAQLPAERLQTQKS